MLEHFTGGENTIQVLKTYHNEKGSSDEKTYIQHSA